MGNNQTTCADAQVAHQCCGYYTETTSDFKGDDLNLIFLYLNYLMKSILKKS